MLVALFLFRIVAIQYATGKPYMHTNIQIYSDTYKQTETNTQHTDIRIQSKRTRFTARELSMYFAIVGGLRARALSLSLCRASCYYYYYYDGIWCCCFCFWLFFVYRTLVFFFFFFLLRICTCIILLYIGLCTHIHSVESHQHHLVSTQIYSRMFTNGNR